MGLLSLCEWLNLQRCCQLTPPPACCLLLFFPPYRIRQWTGDTRGWYAAGVSPIAGMPVPGQAYVFVYSMLTLAFLVLMLFRGAQFQHASLTGCQKLHKHMLHK
jgi:hypothetical protein